MLFPFTFFAESLTYAPVATADVAFAQFKPCIHTGHLLKYGLTMVERVSYGCCFTLYYYVFVCVALVAIELEKHSCFPNRGHTSRHSGHQKCEHESPDGIRFQHICQHSTAERGSVAMKIKKSKNIYNPMLGTARNT